MRSQRARRECAIRILKNNLSKISIDRSVMKMEPKEDTPLLESDQIPAIGGQSISLEGSLQSNVRRTDFVRNTAWGTLFLMLNVMLGAGFLVQPSVFKSAGVIVASFYYLLFGFFCYAGCDVLLYVARQTGCYNYSGLVKLAMGEVRRIGS